MKRKAKASRAGTPFKAAHVVLWGAVLTFAVYGAAGWIVALWQQSPVLAGLMALAFGFAPFAAAALTGPALRGGGIAAWSALIVFTAMDAAGNTNAFFEFEKVALHDQNAAIVQAHTVAASLHAGDLAKAKAAHEASTAKLLSLPTASALCVDVGPKTCEARKAAQAGDREALAAQAALAKAQVDALTAPVAPVQARLLPPEVSATLHTLLSFALVVGFLGLHVAERRHAAREAAKPKAKRTRRAAPKAPPPVAPVQPVSVLTPEERRAMIRAVANT
jgi:hypothetical protein